MNDVVICAENLGKKYTIGHHSDAGSYVFLRDVVMQNARSMWQKTSDLLQGKPMIQGDSMEEFWALRDVSFEIRRGEAVGIIGRNGAGKSTLLKILSRITEPSMGRLTITGRVASLLEVGTGFHQELTGRENIHLNGSILGMTRAEIKLRFDEIVAFAEIEKFLDTPVKRYSSGMYVRLAFAVAAHLEPEILVVDEVLAVGDAEFQEKCLGKMGNVAREGRTILFVSHNMGAINELCSRAILLKDGSVVADGSPEHITREYLSRVATKRAFVELASTTPKTGFRSLTLHSDDSELSSTFDFRKPICLLMKFFVEHRTPALEASLSVFNAKGIHIFYHSSGYTSPPLDIGDAGEHEIRVRIPGSLLAPGAYTISAALHIPNITFFDNQENILAFDIADTGARRYDFSVDTLGCVLVDLAWEHSNVLS